MTTLACRKENPLLTNISSSRNLIVTAGYSFAASSSVESNRFVLMPRLTAASVSLACLATSTRSCKRVTSTRAMFMARSSEVAFPVSLADSIAAATSTRATTARRDRKSTRLNSSHQIISYAVFCLKKKKNEREHAHDEGQK